MNCGADLPTEANFCLGCGKAVAKSEQSTSSELPTLDLSQEAAEQTSLQTADTAEPSVDARQEGYQDLGGYWKSKSHQSRLRWQRLYKWTTAVLVLSFISGIVGHNSDTVTSVAAGSLLISLAFFCAMTVVLFFDWSAWTGRVGRMHRQKASRETVSAAATRTITETKTTCLACGNTWYWRKSDFQMIQSGQQIQNCGRFMHNCGASLMCCSGCFPAAFIPRQELKEVIDLGRCPKCGSTAIKNEQVVHDV